MCELTQMLSYDINLNKTFSYEIETPRHSSKVDTKKTRINFCDKYFFLGSEILYNEWPKEMRYSKY